MRFFSIGTYPDADTESIGGRGVGTAGTMTISDRRETGTRKIGTSETGTRGVSDLGAASLLAGYSGRLSDRLQMRWQKEHGTQVSPIEYARQMIQTSHGILHKEADAVLRESYHREVADRVLVELLKEKGSGWAINTHPSAYTSGHGSRMGQISGPMVGQASHTMPGPIPISVFGNFPGRVNSGRPHVGQIHMVAWAPFLAGAYGLEKFGEMHYGEDTISYLKHIDAAVDAFWEDVVRDICTYGSVKTTDGAKSDSNPFGIVAAETDGYPAWDHSVCNKRGFPIPPLSGQAPHIKSDWLTAFNYWVQDWRSYMANGGKGWADFVGFRPDRAQLDTWYTQLEGNGGWRQQAIKSGVVTITPAADAPAKPAGIPWTTILIVGGILAGAILLGQVRSFIPTKIISGT